MKNQKIRKFIILTLLLALPAIYYYMSPYLIIQGLIEGFISGSAILFISQFITALIFGRVFCGWICPVGGLQETCQLISKKKTRGGIFNLSKYLIWILWLIPILLLIYSKLNSLKIDILYQTDNGISIHRTQDVIIYLAIFGFCYFFTLIIGKRAFCHYICWMAPFMVIGERLGRILHIPKLKLDVANEKCIHCHKCDEVCQMSLKVENMVSKADLNNSECILCGMCIAVCEQKVIKYGFGVAKKR